MTAFELIMVKIKWCLREVTGEGLGLMSKGPKVRDVWHGGEDI